MKNIRTQFIINISYSLALTSVDSIVFCSQLLSLGLVFEFELFLWLLANANSFIWRLTAIALYACCKVEWVNMSLKHWSESVVYFDTNLSNEMQETFSKSFCHYEWSYKTFLVLGNALLFYLHEMRCQNH